MRMISAVLLFFIPASVATTVVACVGEDPNLAGDTAAGGQDADTREAAPADGTTDSGALSDSGAAPDSGAPTDSGALSEDGFEQGFGCGGWLPAAESVLVETTEDHRTGTRSCRVCGTGNYPSIYKDLPISAPGTYELRGFVKSVGDAGPLELWPTIAFFKSGATTVGSVAGARRAPSSTEYALLQAIAPSPDAGFESVRISVVGYSGCYFFDDVVLFQR
jgi:hypothetical protein